MMDPELELVLAPLLKRKIVGVRVGHILANEHIDTLPELLSYTEKELLTLGNFGPASLKALVRTLAKRGLKLGSVPPLYVSSFGEPPLGQLAIELYKNDGGTDWSKASDTAKKYFRRMAVRHRHRLAP